MRCVAVSRGLAGLLLAMGASASGHAASIYAGPQSDPTFTVIAPELSTAMFPNQRVDLVAVSGGAAALERVAEDPGSVAITDLATTLDYARRKALAADRLEFHEVVGQRCVLGFTQKGSWVRSFADMLTTGSGAHPVVGVTDDAAATVLALLRGLEPGLAAVQVVSAPLGDLTIRTARGTVDLLLMVANPDFDHARLEALADDQRLTRVPIVSRQLSRAAADRESGFVMMPVQTDSSLLPWSRAPDVTLCTPIGAVLRNDAPPLLRDTLNRAVVSVAATLKTSLADRTMRAARSALGDAMSAVKGLVGRF